MVLVVAGLVATGGLRLRVDHRLDPATPRTGGPAQRRAVLDQGDVSAEDVDGTVYVSVVRSTPPTDRLPFRSTTYRLTDGNRTEQVAEGFRLTEQIPWARLGTIAPGTDPASPPPEPTPTFLNVVTGERRTPPAVDGVTLVACAPQVCVGQTADAW